MSHGSSDSSTDSESITRVSVKEMEDVGLYLAGHNVYQCSKAMNMSAVVRLERFLGIYGARPVAYCRLFEDMQSTPNEDARLDLPGSVEDFLFCCRWLFMYETERQLSGPRQLNEKTIRNKNWKIAGKIQAMKVETVGILCWDVPNRQCF